MIRLLSVLVLLALAGRDLLQTLRPLAAGSGTWSWQSIDIIVLVAALPLVGVLALWVLGPGDTDGRMSRLAVRWSLVGAAAAASSVLMGLFRAVPGSVVDLLTTDNLMQVLTRSDVLSGRLSLVWVAALVALVARLGGSRGEAAAALALVTTSLLAVLPSAPAMNGHGAATPGPLTIGLLLVQASALILGVGLGLGLVLVARARPKTEIPVSNAEVSNGWAARPLLAGTCCMITAAVATLGLRWMALPPGASPWQETPGLLLLMESVGVALLAMIMVSQLQRMVGVPVSGPPRWVVVAAQALLSAAILTVATLGPPGLGGA